MTYQEARSLELLGQPNIQVKFAGLRRDLSSKTLGMQLFAPSTPSGDIGQDDLQLASWGTGSNCYSRCRDNGCCRPPSTWVSINDMWPPCRRCQQNCRNGSGANC